ncbi:unnamed protein product, partial [Nesidiocoris tenuis]
MSEPPKPRARGTPRARGVKPEAQKIPPSVASSFSASAAASSLAASAAAASAAAAAAPQQKPATASAPPRVQSRGRAKNPPAAAQRPSVAQVTQALGTVSISSAGSGTGSGNGNGNGNGSGNGNGNGGTQARGAIRQRALELVTRPPSLSAKQATTRKDGTPVRIIIKKTTDCVWGDHSYLQVLNILVRKALASLDLQLVGRDYYDALAK